jgi:phosphinothricin acetyltransferase
MIKLAVEADLPAINKIYQQAIDAQFCTADLTMPSPSERLLWFREHQSYKHIIVTYKELNQMLGYAYLSPYRKGREALNTAAELSYYVHQNHRRKGIAQKLLSFLLKHAKKVGIESVFSIIIEGNTPSIELLKTFGFQQWAYLPNVVHCFNERRAHIYMGKELV